MKTCPYCQTKFEPRKFAQVCCHDYKCALKHVRKRRERVVEAAKRKSDRVARVKLKNRSEWLNEARDACNAWIRFRDRRENCISCGRDHQGQYHAGHYRSVGAAGEIRFHPWNINKQCSACNNHKSGNAIEYRIRLVKKIGKEAVEWLEGPHQPQKYTIEDAKEIKAYYRQRLKILKSEG